MIYRHYKGGIYYLNGYATRFSKAFPAKHVKQIVFARYTEPETDAEREPIKVMELVDERTGSTYFAYETEVINGMMTLYKGLDGNYWLRPTGMFHEEVEVGVHRFTKIRGEELFDMISELVAKHL